MSDQSNIKNRSAFPYKFNDITTYQFVDTGMTKLEYYALHLLTAVVAAGEANNKNGLSESLAKRYAETSVLLARALDKVVKGEEGRKYE